MLFTTDLAPFRSFFSPSLSIAVHRTAIAQPSLALAQLSKYRSSGAVRLRPGGILRHFRTAARGRDLHLRRQRDLPEPGGKHGCVGAVYADVRVMARGREEGRGGELGAGIQMEKRCGKTAHPWMEAQMDWVGGGYDMKGSHDVYSMHNSLRWTTRLDLSTSRLD